MASEDSRAAADARSTSAPPSLGPVVALSVALALGPLFVLAPIVWDAAPVTDLPDPFPDHHQTAETLLFVLTFAVLLPAGIAVALRIADRISRGAGSRALSSIAGLLSAGLALVVLVTRVAPDLALGDRPRVLAVGAAVWCVVAAVVLLGASARTRAPTREGPPPTWPWVLTLVLLVPVALSFVDLGSLSWPVLAAGGAVVLFVAAISERARLPRAPGWLGVVLDLGLVALIAVAVPNLFVVPIGDPAKALDTSIIQFHQNFYLGPANQVLHGDDMLVDVLSQYGVGSIYFLAGAFLLVPIGNGTLGLVEGGLSALMFIATFATLRVAGVSRLVAGAAMGVAVVALVYGLENPLGALLQHGAFRFGLPVGVVLGAVVEVRWPRLAVPARLLQLLTFAVAAIWALEAFAYTSLTLLAVAAVGVVTRPAGQRGRPIAGWVVMVTATFLAAHAVFAGATVLASGELPDWGWYLNTLREFLVGDLGDWTYDFTSFSPAYAVGALYLASAAALVVVLLRRPDLRQSQRPMLVAVAGTTAHGVALFSYIVNRGADHIIPYVCLPAVALGALWLTFVRRPSTGVAAPAQRVALVVALALASLLVATAWPTAETRYPESALAHLVPGGTSWEDAMDRLWDPPPLRAEAPEGVELLRTHLPGQRRSIVLTGADLSVEILMGAERGNAVPFGDPWEDSFVATPHLAPLGTFVNHLREGDRLLIDASARTAFDAYRADPSLNPLASGGEITIVPTELASLQEWVLREIGLTFDLRTVARSQHGLEVVELVERPDDD